MQRKYNALFDSVHGLVQSRSHRQALLRISGEDASVGGGAEHGHCNVDVRCNGEYGADGEVDAPRRDGVGGAGQDNNNNGIFEEGPHSSRRCDFTPSD